MPDIRKTLLVSLVFFAGCAGSQVASRYAVPPARAGSGQRWESSQRPRAKSRAPSDATVMGGTECAARNRVVPPS